MVLNFLYNFKKILPPLLLFVLIFNVFSQTPMFYNYAIYNENTNYFPFGVVGGERVQWLYPSGNFNQPGPAPSGNITKLYFFMGFYSGNADLTQLTIKLGQSNITSFSSGSFYSGQLDTVFYAPWIHLSSINGQWMSITLDRPFLYDSSKSLIVDISQCSSSTGQLYVTQHNYTPDKRRNYSFYSPCPSQYYGQDSYACNLGFDLSLVGIMNNHNSVTSFYELEQNFPNPFNPATNIRFSLPIPTPSSGRVNSGETMTVTLKIYDVLGRIVATLVNEKLNPGTYKVEFKGNDYPSGVYFYKLEALVASGVGFVSVKKMVLSK